MQRAPFPTVIDNSLLSEFRACPEKCRRTYFEHWKPRNGSIHLHAGKAFASGLEAARRAFYIGGEGAEESVAFGLGELIREWGDRPPGEETKSIERMCGALESYFDFWPLDRDNAKPVILAGNGRGIEYSFVEPIEEILHPETGTPLLYAGRADMVVDLSQGLFIEDDKTASQLGPTWGSKWELRSQFTGYCWAMARHGRRPDGILVRGISILKNGYGHAQAITYRAPWEIDRWYEQTLRDIRRLIQCWESGVWDLNLSDSCDHYGGCVYTRVCKAESPAEWMPMYFSRRRWDPVSREEIALDTEPGEQHE